MRRLRYEPDQGARSDKGKEGIQGPGKDRQGLCFSVNSCSKGGRESRQSVADGKLFLTVHGSRKERFATFYARNQ